MPIRLVTLSILLVAALGCGVSTTQQAATPEDPATRVQVSAESDERAIEIAQSTVERMGGWEALDSTRFVRWHFFGRRWHHWDRHSGDLRIESEDGLWLMNVHTKEGRYWEKDASVEDPAKLAEALDRGHQIWVNDSYWMFMPYKMLDPGVTLKYSGERTLEDGRAADVLDLTFAGDAGYTPQNRYEVFVARDTGLVEAWAFFAEAQETEPRFTMPWAAWEEFGEIKLATSHGRDADWGIRVYDDLPRSVFDSPEPPQIETTR
ncbi:MAG: hypothetical protein GY716_18450 [bacterium]|nr:hypothetical protein [bacterium]